MTEEVVYNVDSGPKEAHIHCNWCSMDFTYQETGGHMHEFINCSWCGERVKIPRDRLRRVTNSGREVARRG